MEYLGFGEKTSTSVSPWGPGQQVVWFVSWLFLSSEFTSASKGKEQEPGKSEAFKKLRQSMSLECLIAVLIRTAEAKLTNMP